MRYDHPVQILRDTKTAGPTARAAFDISAKVLEEYEKDKGVTFEALDTETLDAVKKHYSAMMGHFVYFAPVESGEAYVTQVNDLLSSLRDLFGLED